jgi:hypothetical protein
VVAGACCPMDRAAVGAGGGAMMPRLLLQLVCCCAAVANTDGGGGEQMMMTAAPPPHWVALAGAAHGMALTACAGTDGGPCATHWPITPLEAAQYTWWNGSTSGDEICHQLGRPPCSRVLAFDCHKKLTCAAPLASTATPQDCGGGAPGHKFCESDLSPGQCGKVPPPTTCPPVDSMALAAQAMILCGAPPAAHGAKKLCLSCRGKCEACPAPWKPPKPGSPKPTPGYQGCLSTLAKSLPYCDAARSIDERVDWLVANMTLAEKIRAISPQPDLGNTCGTHVCGKPSIGLPSYMWLVEANSDVAASCLAAPYRCP